MVSLKQALRRFRREEDGLVLSEFLILLPLLIWAFMAIFVYFDSFRTINEAQKASYAVADLVSRQKNDVTPTMINGLDDAMTMMMSNPGAVRLRVTSIQYTTARTYVVLFSRSPGSTMPPLSAASVRAMATRIPVMAPLDSVVILETEVAFHPLLNIGLGDKTFRNFIVTRPRNLLRVCLSGTICPTVT
ncbi:MAG: hypothetical protein IAE87_02555 [Rhodobacteraceae bacterium]|jgi:hypothetical protein|nr:hypothetical protein [Paracoccaceae bacterium]